MPERTALSLSTTLSDSQSILLTGYICIFGRRDSREIELTVLLEGELQDLFGDVILSAGYYILRI